MKMAKKPTPIDDFFNRAGLKSPKPNSKNISSWFLLVILFLALSFIVGVIIGIMSI
jgi:hypothetical protein